MKRLFMMSGIVLLTVACVFVVGCIRQLAEPEGPLETQAEAIGLGGWGTKSQRTGALPRAIGNGIPSNPAL